MALEVGGLAGVPGQTVRGTHPLVELATAPGPGSGLEELAVVIITAKDVAEGDPKMLFTANIHGPEICPCIVAHRLIEFCEAAMEAGTLKGSVVVYPSLNPTGHRAATRHPQFENPDDTDPNRMWPNSNPCKHAHCPPPSPCMSIPPPGLCATALTCCAPQSLPPPPTRRWTTTR